ncbi:DUF3526 domain-containing protein [Roseateles sp. DAIF2]|uniref:DUF3526 domain-containing protein n=1 Tax=Roseateles sp. DAIF2 TaxID=2714952 RepID=UPI0018A271AD|nr:DUF3526 domain-containing protein [Roseateles sp. DAIF2]QPF76164.1 DUF3526 domain-containing protein [Roseateles sp. DAIF2]
MSGLARGWCAFAGAWSADWRERRRDWRVLLVLALALLLAAAATLIGARELRASQAARTEAQQAERQRWLEQGQKYPHSAAHYGIYAFKPRATLAALDPGVEPYVGSSVWLEAHKQNEFAYRPVNDEPGAVRQFGLSPAFVLQVLVPLAIVFLGFGSFAGERERGQLPGLRLAAAPLGLVAAARAAVLWLLALLLALPACLGVALLQAGAGEPFSDAGARLALFALGYGLYFAAWCLLVVGISALAPSLMRSLAVALALWVLLALLLPRAALQASQDVAPLPSGQAFRAALEAALGEPHDPDVEARQQQTLLAQYGVRTLRELPVNWAGIGLQRGEEAGDRVFDAHYGRLFAALRAQGEAAARWGWASPTVAVAVLSAAAAGSDTAHHLQFVQGAEAHRRLIQRLMNEAIAATPPSRGERVEHGAELWSRVPPLRFVFEPLAGAALLAPLLALLLASAVFCALALRRLRRGGMTR